MPEEPKEPLYSASEMINKLNEAEEKKNSHYALIGTPLEMPKTLARCFRLEGDVNEVDWDGLRRFYDSVEEKGGDAEQAVIRAIRVRRALKYFSKIFL